MTSQMAHIWQRYSLPIALPVPRISLPRDALRAKQAPAPELVLTKADDATILAAMIAHPGLVERPIVVVGDQAAICRPPERVLDLLDKD